MQTNEFWLRYDAALKCGVLSSYRQFTEIMNILVIKRTFKKLSNEPLSRNSVSIIIGLPKMRMMHCVRM